MLRNGTFGQSGKKNLPLTFTLNGVKTTLTFKGGSGTASRLVDGYLPLVDRHTADREFILAAGRRA